MLPYFADLRCRSNLQRKFITIAPYYHQVPYVSRVANTNASTCVNHLLLYSMLQGGPTEAQMLQICEMLVPLAEIAATTREGARIRWVSSGLLQWPLLPLTSGSVVSPSAYPLIFWVPTAQSPPPEQSHGHAPAAAAAALSADVLALAPGGAEGGPDGADQGVDEMEPLLQREGPAEGFPEGFSEVSLGEISAGVPVGVQEGGVEGVPEGVLEGVSEGVPEGGPERVEAAVGSAVGEVVGSSQGVEPWSWLLPVLEKAGCFVLDSR